MRLPEALDVPSRGVSHLSENRIKNTFAYRNDRGSIGSLTEDR